MEEVWRDVSGFEGKYQVSNLGNIRSMRYNGGNRKTPKILSLRKRHDGYMDVNLGNAKKLVHRLVWEAFNGPIPDGLEVNHINCIRNDNRLANLNLLSHTDNVRWDDANNKRGKSIIQYTLNKVFIKEWETEKEIERQLGFDQTCISACCLGKRNTSHGFIWKFKN